ncbi:MAG: hypothetical protein V1850_00295 [Candidatus Bathyarchaeota archaeon]
MTQTELSFEEIPSITKPFYLYTKGQMFTADTLRSSPYGKYLDPVHGYGGVLAQWKRLGLSTYEGETRSSVASNKGRKVDCFIWSDKAKKMFEVEKS